MNKYEIQVDGVTYVVDDISYEYSQLDGDESGRSEDGSMYRDVIGLTNKVACDFLDKDKWKGAKLSALLQIVKKKSCSFNYFDILENERVTKNMYVVTDPIKVGFLNEETILKDNVQIRFIQMNVDDI